MTSPNSCHDENQKREEEVGQGGDALLSLCDEKEVTEASPTVFFFFAPSCSSVMCSSCCCCFFINTSWCFIWSRICEDVVVLGFTWMCGVESASIGLLKLYFHVRGPHSATVSPNRAEAEGLFCLRRPVCQVSVVSSIQRSRSCKLYPEVFADCKSRRRSCEELCLLPEVVPNMSLRVRIEMKVSKNVNIWHLSLTLN